MKKFLSIKKFLLFNLLISIVITAVFTGVSDYFLDNMDIKKQLDIQLQQSVEFINSIFDYSNLKNASTKDYIIHITDDKKFKKTKFQFQITDKNKNILLNSSHSFIIPKTKINTGFSTQKINNKIWRIYTKHNPKSKTFFSIGEEYDLRAQLEHRIILDNLMILIWTYPILALFIWLTVNRGFNTLKKIILSLDRSPTNFELINIKNIPIEIQPLVKQLNTLFSKLQKEFERSKRFASDAAHELRTPLAALKTQTEVALLNLSDNQIKEKEFLDKILLGIDRCVHIVQQLLILSRLDQEEIIEDFHHVNLYKILSETIAELAPNAVEKNIEIELLQSEENAFIYGNETILKILMRNLIDNAIRYTTNDGLVKTQITKENDQISLKITDNGPGIPKELRVRVFERFYRMLGTKEQGSGLGLPIVQQIADLHHAVIKLSDPKIGTGLEIEINFKSM